MEIYRGIVTSYSRADHTADVMLVGSLSRVMLSVPVSYQVAPAQMKLNTRCGVMLFAEGDQGVVMCTFGVPSTRPRDVQSVIGNAWSDHFLGEAFRDEYDKDLSTGSTIQLMDAAHGGVLEFKAGAGQWRRAILWLGDAAGNYDTLDADEGWMMRARFKLDVITNILARMGARDASQNNAIYVGATINTGPNWYVQTRTGGGGWNNVASDVAVDTEWHEHEMSVYPTDAPGHQVDYWLDGTVIASTTVDVPTAVLTPMLAVTTAVASVKKAYFDRWDVIVRNLA